MNHLKMATCFFAIAPLFSSISYAQIPDKDAAIAITPYWTGFYAGVNAGAIRNSMNITDIEAATFGATIQQVSNPNFTGGFQLGYRRQIDAALSGVFGLEFSMDFSDANFIQYYGSPYALYELRSEHKLKNVALLQVIGGIAAGRTLLFLSAGASWSNLSGNTYNLDTIPFYNGFNVSKKAFGTALGAGVEYGYTDAISLRLKVDVINANSYLTLDNTLNKYQISNTIVIGTLGLNYTFG